MFRQPDGRAGSSRDQRRGLRREKLLGRKRSGLISIYGIPFRRGIPWPRSSCIIRSREGPKIDWPLAGRYVGYEDRGAQGTTEVLTLFRADHALSNPGGYCFVHLRRSSRGKASPMRAPTPMARLN
jgi:hypothetical protein